MESMYSTQHWNIFEQGRRGVRFFDIDVAKDCRTFHFKENPLGPAVVIGPAAYYESVGDIMKHINRLLVETCPNDVYFVNVNDLHDITAHDATHCVIEAARKLAEDNQNSVQGIQGDKLWLAEPEEPKTGNGA